MVGGGQRAQGQLIIPGRVDQRLGLTVDGLYTLLPNGAIDKSGLAKAAAANTAPKNFFHCPVVDNVNKRHHKAVRIIALVHIGHNGLLHRCRCSMGGGQGAQGAVRVVAVLIKRRHINALNMHGCFQKLLLTLAALFTFFQQIQHRIGGLFPLAQEDDVRKLRHRLRVAGAGAAKGHNGGQRLSIPGTQRHPRQIQHIQNIGIRQLILHGKADHIKVLDRVAAFQGKQRFAVGAHQRLHIVRRGKHQVSSRALATP